MINQELIEFANYLADLSSKIAIKYFRNTNFESTKEDNTPVTKADKEIEEVLRSEISKKYPNHGIIGEEYEDINLEADYKWIIDPIDGTSSFIIGKANFGNLICLSYKNKPIIGIINQPINKERWVGIAQKHTIFNGKIVKCRKSGSISNSILCTTSPVFFKGDDLSFFNSVAQKTKYQKYGGVFYGGDCYLFGLMSLGHIDIIIETGLNIYDYASLIPVIEESGGIITNWSGDKLDLNSGSQILACGDKKVHEEILKLQQNLDFI